MLSLDEKTCLGAMKLFKETKHLFSSNVSAAERTVAIFELTLYNEITKGDCVLVN